MKDLYPLFLSLAGLSCLIVGFGPVGQRKLKKLLEARPGKILVLDLAPLSGLGEEAAALIAHEGCVFEQRTATCADIEASFLVFACTDNFAENRRIGEYCKKIKRLCNNVTEPPAGNFIVPASLCEGGLAAALSSSGNSAALSAALKREIRPVLRKYALFGEFLGLARKRIQNYNEKTLQRQLWLKGLAGQEFMQSFTESDEIACKAWLAKNLPHDLGEELSALLEACFLGHQA